MIDWTVVGFSGHRDLEVPETARRTIAILLQRLCRDHGPLIAAASAASGADTLFLEESRRSKLPSFLVLPFAETRFREDFEADDWARVQPLIAHALHVDVVGDTESVNEAYLESGIRVVDQSDVLIAVWNGKPAQGTGGTADVVSYARSLGKPVLVIDPETGECSEEPIRRPPAPAESAVADTHRMVSDHFTRLNQQAAREGPRSRQLVLQVILIHLGAAAVGLLPAVFGWHDLRLQVALGIEMAALFAALVITFFHRHSHHAWVRTRFEAEMCRAFLAIWRLPRTIGSLPRLAYPWSERLYRNLRIAWYLDRKDPPELLAARQTYLDTRVQHQADYFRKHHQRAWRRIRLLKTIAQIATVGAIVTGLVALSLSIFAHAEPHDLFSTAKLLALLLPLVNAAALSVVAANDLARRATRYRQMADALESMATRLATVATWPGLWRVVTEAEELLFREINEWQTVTQFTGDSH